MNEESKSVWKRPLKGPLGFLAWCLLVAGAAFAGLFAVGLLENPQSLAEWSEFALVASVAAALAIVGGVRSIRWLCCWRNLRRFLFGGAFVITLIALFYAEEDWRGKRAWDKHRREWEAKGEKFGIPALAPPLVPDKMNFALAPLLRPALEFTRTTNRVVWSDTNAYAHLLGFSAAMWAKGEGRKKLEFGSLEKGTLADLEGWREFYHGNTNYPQTASSGTAASEILVALGKFDADIAGLREAAAERPEARFPIEYDYEPASEILLPHLSSVKVLCQLLQVRATAELERDQNEAAFADLELAFRLSDAIRDEPILIDHLVRIATVGINLQTIREGLARHAWSDAQLTELDKYLASVNLLAEYKHAMRGERAFLIASLDYIRRQGFRPNANEWFGDDSLPSPVLALAPSGWFYQNMLTISQMHEDFTFPAVNENSHRVLPDYLKRLDDATAALRTGRYRPYKMFATVFFPALSKAILKSARMQTYVDEARVACALERYRMVNGNHPESLAVLQPGFLDKVPNDVMDGKPLRYRTTEGGYLLYSVGWNQTDEGGELAWMTDKERTLDDTKGDWAWTHPEK
jgi:hypothetical protein